MDTPPPTPETRLPAPPEILDRLGLGLILTSPKGEVKEANDSATRLAVDAFGEWPSPASCCRLFGCRARDPLADHCISELASRSPGPLPEIRVDLPPKQPSSAVWLTAARIGEEGSDVLIHLRPAQLGDRRQRTQPHWMEGPRLRIDALGQTRVTTQETAIEGRWLLQRPGELLKYLVCQRGRPAHIDEIADALWPKAGISSRSTVRYYIHQLRDLLEPSRESRAPSAFVVSLKGSYALDPRVKLDLNEFEALATAGLDGTRGAEIEPESASLLAQAMDLYRGDLFQEEPFATWTFTEREHLRGLSRRALQALVGHYRRTGDNAAALESLERFADLWPLDTDVQRLLIELYIEQGRRSDSQRRFAALRARLRDEFGEEPEFTLAEIVALRNDSRDA